MTDKRKLIIDKAFTHELATEIKKLFVLHTERFIISTSPHEIVVRILPEPGDTFATGGLTRTIFNHDTAHTIYDYNERDEG